MPAVVIRMVQSCMAAVGETVCSLLMTPLAMNGVTKRAMPLVWATSLDNGGDHRINALVRQGLTLHGDGIAAIIVLLPTSFGIEVEIRTAVAAASRPFKAISLILMRWQAGTQVLYFLTTLCTRLLCLMSSKISLNDRLFFPAAHRQDSKYGIRKP